MYTLGLGYLSLGSAAKAFAADEESEQFGCF